MLPTTGWWSSSSCATANPVHRLYGGRVISETFAVRLKAVLPSDAALYPDAQYTRRLSFFSPLCSWLHRPIENKRLSPKRQVWALGTMWQQWWLTWGLLEEQNFAFSSTFKAAAAPARALPCCFFSFGAAKVFYEMLVWHLAKAWGRANDGELLFPAVSPDR